VRVLPGVQRAEPAGLGVPGLVGFAGREIGTRRGTRALTCWKQAVFVLARFRDRPDVRRLGQGFGISQATAYRYLSEAVGVLAAKAPHDRQLIELIGELSTQSIEVRTRWAAHNVRFHRTGHKGIRHPVVAILDLDFAAMEFPAHPGLTLLAYTAAAGTPTADSLKMLASWAATARANREPACRHRAVHSVVLSWC
jgi:MmyB-like transcription regulator ligand binding domain/Helix-turn-helix of DDE superfamily endonuclease